MCVLSDCVVRIETGLWVIRLHYVAYVPEMLSIWLLWSGPRDRSAWAMGVACRGHWPLGTSGAQFTVYRRLRHSLTDHDRCPTARTAARPIPEGMTIFCLPTASTSQIHTTWLYLCDWGQYGRPPLAFSWASCIIQCCLNMKHKYCHTTPGHAIYKDVQKQNKYYEDTDQVIYNEFCTRYPLHAWVSVLLIQYVWTIWADRQ